MIKLVESASTDKISKLKTILIANGKLSENGNYVVERELKAYYNPKSNSIVCMEPIWGYPRYISDSKGLYKKNAEGKTASLTLGTLITNVLNQIKHGSKLDDYDDEGHLIS